MRSGGAGTGADEAPDGEVRPVDAAPPAGADAEERLEEERSTSVVQVTDRPGERPVVQPRLLVGSLVLLTALAYTCVFGFVAVVGIAGPSLYGDEEGGTLALRLSPHCDSPILRLSERTCFEHANATIDYGGRTENLPLQNDQFRYGIYGKTDLQQARATVRVESDQGTWVREIWTTKGGEEAIQIDPSDPRTTSGIIGHEPGQGWLFAMAAGGTLILLVASATWLLTARPGAAHLMRALLVLWLTAQGVVVMVSLLLARLAFAPLLFGVWLYLLYRWTSRWIRREQAARPASPEPDLPVEV